MWESLAATTNNRSAYSALVKGTCQKASLTPMIIARVKPNMNQQKKRQLVPGTSG
jgi:hypothetical protein